MGEALEARGSAAGGVGPRLPEVQLCQALQWSRDLTKKWRLAGGCCPRWLAFNTARTCVLTAGTGELTATPRRRCRIKARIVQRRACQIAYLDDE